MSVRGHGGRTFFAGFGLKKRVGGHCRRHLSGCVFGLKMRVGENLTEKIRFSRFLGKFYYRTYPFVCRPAIITASTQSIWLIGFLCLPVSTAWDSTSRSYTDLCTRNWVAFGLVGLAIILPFRISPLISHKFSRVMVSSGVTRFLAKIIRVRTCDFINSLCVFLGVIRCQPSPGRMAVRCIIIPHFTADIAKLTGRIECQCF